MLLRRNWLVCLLLFSFLISGYASDSEREAKLRSMYAVDQLEHATQSNPNDYETLLALSGAYTSIVRAAQVIPGGWKIRRKYKKLEKKVNGRIENLKNKDYRYHVQKSKEGIGLLGRVPRKNIDAIEKAVSMAPENPQTYYEQYRLLVRNRKWDEAFEAYRKAIDLEAARGRDATALNHARLEILIMAHCVNQESIVRDVLQDIYQTGIENPQQYMQVLTYFHMYRGTQDEGFQALSTQFKQDKRYESLRKQFARLGDKGMDGLIKGVNWVCQKDFGR